MLKLGLSLDELYGGRDPLPDHTPCMDLDPESFFSSSQFAREAAKLACRRCAGIETCLRFALDHQVEGVWGGTTQAERRVMIKQRSEPTR